MKYRTRIYYSDEQKALMRDRWQAYQSTPSKTLQQAQDQALRVRLQRAPVFLECFSVVRHELVNGQVQTPQRKQTEANESEKKDRKSEQFDCELQGRRFGPVAEILTQIRRLAASRGKAVGGLW